MAVGTTSRSRNDLGSDCLELLVRELLVDLSANGREIRADGDDCAALVRLLGEHSC
jgi:hypothetical protein